MTETAPQLSAFAVDGIEPKRVATPQTEAETADLLAEAASSRLAVIPVGGATMLSVGNPPASYDLALSTSRLTGIVEYNPADLTIVVRAGTTISALDQELRSHGQFLPLDVPYPDRATVGGALAMNSSGPWRTAYGSARDMVIGMRMALPSGEIARSGGRVVKNVAGYDLAKLFIGSHGTLGVIVEVAFKIYPRPQVTQTLVLPAESEDAARQLGVRFRALGPGLLVLAVLSPGLGQSLGLEGNTVMVTVGGTAGTVQELAEEVRRLAGETQAQIIPDDGADRLHGVLRDFPGSATAKISTLPSDTGARLALPASAAWVAYPAVGLTYVRRDDWSAAEVEMLRARLRQGGGHAVLVHASPQLKAEAGVWGSAGPEVRLMQKVKDVFDPRDIMSPGRFVV